jgi:hypothetical protein
MKTTWGTKSSQQNHNYKRRIKIRVHGITTTRRKNKKVASLEQITTIEETKISPWNKWSLHREQKLSSQNKNHDYKEGT